MRKHNVIMFTLLIIWIIAIFYKDAVIPIPYEQQLDARKREYVSATIIDKFYTEGCSKVTCYKDYYFTLELSDGSIAEYIKVTSEFYESQSIGNIARFERHLADPIVIQQQTLSNVITFLWFVGIVLWFVGWILVYIFVGKSTHE